MKIESQLSLKCRAFRHFFFLDYYTEWQEGFFIRRALGRQRRRPRKATIEFLRYADELVQSFFR